jgi:hypothetical protein
MVYPVPSPRYGHSAAMRAWDTAAAGPRPAPRRPPAHRRTPEPLYQAFGGGNYPDDAKGYWVLPTAAQERQLLAAWAQLVPDPKFDYAYSWGSQQGDTAMSQSPALQAVFTAKNKSS